MKWLIRRTTVLIIAALGYGACVATAILTSDLRLVNACFALFWTFGFIVGCVFYHRMTTVDKDKVSWEIALLFSGVICFVSVVMAVLHITWQGVSPAWIAQNISWVIVYPIAFLLVLYRAVAMNYKSTRPH